jgi:outer membrane receptor protein involved in Fe transport
VQSFINYRNSSDSFSGSIGLNRDTLEYFNIAPIRPEQVRSFELGYRTTVGEKLYVDAGYYFSIYQNFIGYNIGLDANFIGDEQLPRTLDVYRYAANSIEVVRTQGFSVGLNYFLNNHVTLNGNYSWNQLISSVDDPIIPAFNTPANKFNVGATGRDYKLRNKDTWGFSFNYRWVQGFLFEGSPQFTGFVPQYDLLDVQVNCRIDAIQTTFKAGASNLLQNIHIETYGGPYVGRLAYVSAVFDLNHKD